MKQQKIEYNVRRRARHSWRTRLRSISIRFLRRSHLLICHIDFFLLYYLRLHRHECAPTYFPLIAIVSRDKSQECVRAVYAPETDFPYAIYHSNSSSQAVSASQRRERKREKAAGNLFTLNICSFVIIVGTIASGIRSKHNTFSVFAEATNTTTLVVCRLRCVHSTA